MRLDQFTARAIISAGRQGEKRTARGLWLTLDQKQQAGLVS